MEKLNKNKSVRAVPEGFHTVTPFLIVNDASKLIDFLKNAFNGQATFVMKTKENKVMHATVKIGDSIIMMGDVMENMQPQTAMLYLYVQDVDTLYKKAVQAKATSIQKPKDEFYGDRAAAVKDEFGNVWWIATHVEDVEGAELERRAKQAERKQKEKPDEVHA